MSMFSALKTVLLYIWRLRKFGKFWAHRWPFYFSAQKDLQVPEFFMTLLLEFLFLWCLKVV